jgi:hypothetical protein
MERAFIRKGDGYERGSRTGEDGRCNAFDGFEIIASPLGGFSEADRERRIFPGRSGGPGVTYGSHAIQLARREGDREGSDLYILMHNGSGREVLLIPSFYDGGALERHIYHLPERVQYALLYSMWQAASNARYEAQRDTATKWATAYAEGRIRKRRATSQRGARVEIVQPWEVEARKRSA